MLGHPELAPLHRYGAHDGFPGPTTLPHCPLAAHASHAPAHAPLQHTPSVQYPLAHSCPLPQPAPCPFCATHEPPAQ